MAPAPRLHLQLSVAAIGPLRTHVRIAGRQRQPALPGLVDELRGLRIAEVVDGAQRGRMAADKAPSQRTFGIGGRRVGLLLPDVDVKDVTAQGHTDIEHAGQRRHRAQRLVRAERRVRSAPAPLARIIAIGRLQLVQRTGQRLP